MPSERRYVAVALVLAFAPASCLLNWDSLREPDGGVDSGGDASTFDAEASDDTPIADVSDAGGDTNNCVLQLLINEVQADGPLGPGDEFVELRNGAPCGGSLFNWALAYSSAGGSSPAQLWSGQAGDTIGPQGPTGYVILGGFTFQAPDGGTVTGRISTSLQGSLSKNGGGVGLFDSKGGLVDSVAYANLTTSTHPFVRPLTAADGGASTPAPNPSTQSIARIPDGENTNTSAVDFQVKAPTPGASN